MTSIGSLAGRSMPHRDAAVRCDAMASGPTASTAAQISWRRDVGEVATRATPGWSGISRPLSIAR